MFDKCELKINTSLNHEGKCLVEVIKMEQKKKFIKQYYLDSKQLSTLQYYITQKNIPYKIVNQDNFIETQTQNLIELNNKISFNHPEFRKSNVDSLEAYKQTLKAKYNQ